jgi:hypothetical protein
VGFLVQSSISSRTATRVPFRQPLRSPCQNSAPSAQRDLSNVSRTVASSVGGLCQVGMTENGGFLTYVLQGDYFIAQAREKGCSPLVYTLDRRAFFRVPSVTHVNIDRGGRVMGEPGNQI